VFVVTTIGIAPAANLGAGEIGGGDGIAILHCGINLLDATKHAFQ
jgi:hypothetical protein